MAVVQALGTALVAALLAQILLLLLVLWLELPVILVIVVMTAVLVYAVTAGVLGAFDLRTPNGWSLLALDSTWGLPNRALGTYVGALIYLWFGTPSRALSRAQAWVAMRARRTSGFLVLKAVGSYGIWHLKPRATCAVSGSFGWIYYATPFEMWADGTQRHAH